MHFAPFRIICTGLLLVTASLFTGCATRDRLPAEAENKTIVVATIFPMADWARQVGGERVYVQTLLPAGASPHTYDPAPRDMRIISHSSLFIRAGLDMDNWGSSLIRAAGTDSPTLLSLGEELTKKNALPDVAHIDTSAEALGNDHHGHDHGHDHDHSSCGHNHGGVNPHFWLDPVVAIHSIEIIRDALIEADPEGKAVYEENAGRYIADLKNLDSELDLLFQPVANQGFVSFHNAWPYLAQRYDLRIVAVIEEFAGKAPSEKYLRAVTQRLKELNIKTVFSEPQLNAGVAKIIADEIGGSVGLLDPYGTEGDPQRGSYLAMMRYNGQQLIKAMQSDQQTVVPPAAPQPQVAAAAQ